MDHGAWPGPKSVHNLLKICQKSVRFGAVHYGNHLEGLKFLKIFKRVQEMLNIFLGVMCMRIRKLVDVNLPLR